MESLETGTLPGTGSVRCVQCEYVLSLAAFDELPACPACGSHEFARASLFTQPPSRSHPDEEMGAWAEKVCSEVTEAGLYLAWEDRAEPCVVALTGEWPRIGRSLAAHIRFDAP